MLLWTHGLPPAPLGIPRQHGSQPAAERVSSLGEDGSARDRAGVRSPMSPTTPEQQMEQCMLTMRRPQGTAGEEQDTARCTSRHRCTLQPGKRPAQHPHLPGICAAAHGPGHHVFLPSCM